MLSLLSKVGDVAPWWKLIHGGIFFLFFIFGIFRQTLDMDLRIIFQDQMTVVCKKEGWKGGKTQVIEFQQAHSAE